MKKKYNYTFIAVSITYIFFILGILIYFFYLKDSFFIPPCPIYTHLGIYCPACGGTRAVISLLNIDLLSSIIFNPIVIYTLFFSTLYIITELINIIFHKRININFKIIIKIGIILLFVNCIIKNIFIILKTL